MRPVAADAQQARLLGAGRGGAPVPRPARAARPSGERPARSGETVRNSSSTSPAASSEPKTCGPASEQDRPASALVAGRRPPRPGRRPTRRRARRPRPRSESRRRQRWLRRASVVSTTAPRSSAGMVRVERAARGDHRELGLGGQPEPPAQLGERARPRRGRRAPAVQTAVRRAVQRPRAERARSRRTRAGGPSRTGRASLSPLISRFVARLRADRDDAVERLDEVRDEQRRRRSRTARRTAARAPPAGRRRAGRRPRRGARAVHERWTSARNSCRSAWSSVVARRARTSSPCASAPRRRASACRGATPRGGRRRRAARSGRRARRRSARRGAPAP